MAQGWPGSRGFANPLNLPGVAAPVFFSSNRSMRLRGSVLCPLRGPTAPQLRGPEGAEGRPRVPQPFTPPNDERCQPSLAGTIVFCVPFGLTEFVGDHLMPTHPGIHPAASNTVRFNVALNLRGRRFSQLGRYWRMDRRSGDFFRFHGRILTRFRGGGRRGRFFRCHERRGEWGGNMMNS